MQETQATWVGSLGREDPLEKEMATHSSILAWKTPWTEEPGRLQSMGSQRIGHNWARMGAHAHTHTHTQDLSSPTRDGTCVPCTVRWILNGRPITEVLFFFFPSPLPTLFFPFFFFLQMYVSRGERTKREAASSPYPGQKLEITHIFV